MQGPVTASQNSSGMLQLINAAAATGGMGAVDLTLSATKNMFIISVPGRILLQSLKKIVTVH